MWKAVSVILVVMATTPWNSVTLWAVCLVCVTSMALYLGVCVICGLDNAHAKMGWRAHSVQTVCTTTIIGVYTSRVREHNETSTVTLITIN